MRHIQPAKKGYFFNQCYVDIKNVIGETFAQIKDSIDVQVGHMEFAGKFRMIFHISVIVSLWVFGGLISLIISAIHTFVNFVIMLFYYLLFLVVLIIDRVYLSVHKIAFACHECHAMYMYPIYLCPNCGEEHDRLTPSVYGAFRRTCNCGYKLPTSVLNFKNKRKDLEAFCPECAKSGRNTVLMDRESRPICIPVVGGPSVGKSAFITAYAYLFIERLSIERGVDVEFYNETCADTYRQMKNFYRTGQIIKTAVQTDINKASSIAFSFFAKHPSLKPERLIHIYDIAGESFIDGENETQKQYDYCDGIVLLLDPFSITEVMARFGSRLGRVDRGGTSSTSIDSMMEMLIRKLEETTNLSRGKILSTPLAIVLNKSDEANLDSLIGDAAVKKAMDRNPEVFVDRFDTMDYLCREFLRKTDMGDVLSHIQQNFKQTRFFAATAMGHTLNEGEYRPRNVAPVFDWVFSKKDKKLASVIATEEFTDKKLPIESDIESVDLNEIDEEETSFVEVYPDV